MTTKPKGAALNKAIIDAANRLDKNQAPHFMRDGRPQVAALSDVLGYRITAGERDAALAAAASGARKPSATRIGGAALARIRALI